MARMARKRSDSGIYHIILRGINRQNIFEDDGDRYKFLDIIKYFKTQSKYKLYSYCLMSNHVHILIQETDDSISVALKRICSSYVLWYNKKYDRSGHLFQERFKSEPVENTGYLITCLRYIHQNPLKAGMVNNIFEAKWTSHYDYISEPNLIDINFILDIFSPDRDKAIDLYTEFMDEENEDQCLDMEDKIVLSDEEVIIYLRSLGVPSVTALQQMDLASRNTIIKKMKDSKAVPIRQIARITGVSKSVIGRI